MISVYINGIKQLEGIDFRLGENTISFSRAPSFGSDIEISNGFTRVANIIGDGSTYLFQILLDMAKHNALINMLHDSLKYSENPAVADALERLRVVVELVKENG